MIYRLFSFGGLTKIFKNLKVLVSSSVSKYFTLHPLILLYNFAMNPFIGQTFGSADEGRFFTENGKICLINT